MVLLAGIVLYDTAVLVGLTDMTADFGLPAILEYLPSVGTMGYFGGKLLALAFVYRLGAVRALGIAAVGGMATSLLITINGPFAFAAWCGAGPRTQRTARTVRLPRGALLSGCNACVRQDGLPRVLGVRLVGRRDVDHRPRAPRVLLAGPHMAHPHTVHLPLRQGRTWRTPTPCTFHAAHC